MPSYVPDTTVYQGKFSLGNKPVIRMERMSSKSSTECSSDKGKQSEDPGRGGEGGGHYGLYLWLSNSPRGDVWVKQIIHLVTRYTALRYDAAR